MIRHSIWSGCRNFAVLVTIVFAVSEVLIGASVGAQVLETGPNIKLEDAELEARARTITKELRCPTCVSQSVDSSNVGISQDLKVLVRERLLAGDSDQEVYEYVAQRYGDFVLLKPRFSLANSVLWISPMLLLIIVGGGLVIKAKKKKQDDRLQTESDEAPVSALLNEEEAAELSSLLGQNDEKGTV